MSRATQPSREARFEQLYRSTAKDLLAFLARRASDPEEATDLLAEVFIMAWRRLDSVPVGDQARLWLFRVARNHLMKSNHRQRTNQALVHDLTDQLSRLPAYQPDALGDGLTDKMRLGLRKLPVRQREVLLLTAWEGLKPREIAKVTGSTANIVRVRLHHARQHLAQELHPARPGQAEPDDPPPDPLPGAQASAVNSFLADSKRDRVG